METWTEKFLNCQINASVPLSSVIHQSPFVSMGTSKNSETAVRLLLHFSKYYLPRLLKNNHLPPIIRTDGKRNWGTMIRLFFRALFALCVNFKLDIWENVHYTPSWHPMLGVNNYVVSEKYISLSCLAMQWNCTGHNSGLLLEQFVLHDSVVLEWVMSTQLALLALALNQ